MLCQKSRTDMKNEFKIGKFILCKQDLNRLKSGACLTSIKANIKEHSSKGADQTSTSCIKNKIRLNRSNLHESKMKHSQQLKHNSNRYFSREYQNNKIKLCKIKTIERSKRVNKTRMRNPSLIIQPNQNKGKKKSNPKGIKSKYLTQIGYIL